MSGFERGIADVFAALEQWLISTGATQSMMRLAWAVLTSLWLGHVAVSLRPGSAPDIVGIFGRMFVAVRLLLAIGFLNQIVQLAFLTLLLELFLAPLAVALLAAPGTARWTARWAVVIVRTGLVVFCVRVIHAAAIYLAVIVPVRQVFAGNASGPGLPGGIASFAGLFQAGLLLMQMVVGTGIGVYAMLRAERLTGRFVDGGALGDGARAAGGPIAFGRPSAARAWRSGM